MKARNGKSFWLIPLALILLGLSACKVDIDHTIWLNKDDSGKARVEMTINFPRIYDEEGVSDMGTENALSPLEEKVRNTAGTEIIEYSIRTDHNDEDYSYIYCVEFSFSNPKSMQNVLFIDPDQGFSLEKVKGGKQLMLDTRQLAMQDEGEAMQYIDLLDFSLGVTINLPSKAKQIGEIPDYSTQENSVNWDMVMDAEYYTLGTNYLSVIY